MCVNARWGSSFKLSKPDRILQICHSSGNVKLDEAEAKDDGLHIEGVLEVGLLYLTDDDTEPVGTATEVVPFRPVWRRRTESMPKASGR